MLWLSLEHHGPGPMRAPTDANCVACHGDAEMMQASAQMGRNLPPSAFDYSPDLGRVVFHTKRPEQGYTQVLHRFATDHPEFRIIREKLAPDTLQFNHELHLTQAKVSLNGRAAFDCDDCHKLDSSGIFHLKVTYDANCKACHPIQFDPKTPALLVPHGISNTSAPFCVRCRSTTPTTMPPPTGLAISSETRNLRCRI